MIFERTARSPEQLRDIAAELMSHPHDGKEWLRVTVEPVKGKRSAAQNRWYWGVLLKAIRDHIYDSTGKSFSAEDLHDEFKARFGWLEIRDRIDGSQHIGPRSTTKYSVGEFAGYLTKIEAYAIDDLGVEIPTNPDADLIFGTVPRIAA